VRHPGLALLIALATAPPLRAQSVQGRVLLQTSEEPVAGALVILLDTAGTEVARAATTTSGGFMVRAPGSGTYQVVVRQIGLQAWKSAAFPLTAGAEYPLTLRIEPTPYVLPPITVAARRSRCNVAFDDDDLIGGLLEAASTALGIAEESAEAGAYGFSTDSYLKRLSTELAVVESTSTDLLRLTRWPIQSADPDSLRRWGFVRGMGDQDQGPTYYGPDARVLFSDWFLESHCFEVESVDDDMVEVQFEPEDRGDRVDLEGRLVIDRKSLELRRMAFEYVGLPRWVPRDVAGGQVELRRLGAGAWVPTAWYLRAPLPSRSEPAARITLLGWMETGGRVTAVHTARGLPDSALTAELLTPP
jgi:Carboxypeptidase regulatory-like domain